MLAFRQQKDSLAEGLDGADHTVDHIEEYRVIHRTLGKIAELGGTPLVMPEAVAGDSLLEILAGRLNYLKTQGKINDEANENAVSRRI